MEKPTFESGPESAEAIESEIERLIGELDNFDFDDYSAVVQDEWYAVEEEAQVGKDRSGAKARLEEFIKYLKEHSKK
ncbi:MAG: hypothetical protein PHW53_03000 [Patescibacteria group bacterium]|nr:hypothetical protein [Patescibacteria group bacterium]